MCSSKHRGPRPKSAGNVPSKLSSPFLFSFHQSSTSQTRPKLFPIEQPQIPALLCFALLAQFTTVPPRGDSTQKHPAGVLRRGGGPLTDLLLCQAQVQEAKSPSCVPPKLVHGVRDETEGSSRLWKRVAGRGARRVNGTCHWLGAAGQ